MAYLFLVADAHWADGLRRFVSTRALAAEAQADLEDGIGWAEQFDMSDDHATPFEPTPGGHGEALTYALPSLREWPGEAPAFERAVLRALIYGYSTAAAFVPRGVVGIELGHGDSADAAPGAVSFVDLAPAGLLRVELPDLEAIATSRRAIEQEVTAAWAAGRSAFDGTERSPRAIATVALGLALRGEGPRARQPAVRRVDLFACNVGVGRDGLRLLTALHRIWRIRVRGLRGLLRTDSYQLTERHGLLTGITAGGGYEMFVTDPVDQSRELGGPYRDRIPEDSLWISVPP